MSGRLELAAYLAGGLPNVFLVVDHDADLTITKPTVLTYTEKVEVGVRFGERVYTVAVIVTIPKQTGGESYLEDALEEVLELFDLHEFWTWSSAEWATYNDTFPAYKVTASITVLRQYDPEPDPSPEED